MATERGATTTRQPGEHRTRVERERDLVREAAMYLQRQPMHAIAAVVGISVDQVNYDINRTLIPRWRRESAASTGEHVARELARINRLEEVYWEAWERSLTDREVRFSSTVDRTRTAQLPQAVIQAALAMQQQLGVAQTTTQLPASESRASLTREGRDGNPLFLMGIQWCIERRCKLLGLDAPEKIDIEAHIRIMATSLGLDPEVAVREALEVMREARQRAGMGTVVEQTGLLA